MKVEALIKIDWHIKNKNVDLQEDSVEDMQTPDPRLMSSASQRGSSPCVWRGCVSFIDDHNSFNFQSFHYRVKSYYALKYSKENDSITKEW